MADGQLNLIYTFNASGTTKWSQSGEILAICDYVSLILWNAKTKTVVFSVEHMKQSGYEFLEWSPDDQLIALKSSNGMDLFDVTAQVIHKDWLFYFTDYRSEVVFNNDWTRYYVCNRDDVEKHDIVLEK